MFPLHFTFISDLYKRFRRRFIQNNSTYKHYYHEYDLPRFYFTYNGKILFESNRTYLEYNIHDGDYIHLEFSGILGGFTPNIIYKLYKYYLTPDTIITSSMTFNNIVNILSRDFKNNLVSGVPTRFDYLFRSEYNNLTLWIFESNIGSIPQAIPTLYWDQCPGSRKIIIALFDFDSQFNTSLYKTFHCLHSGTTYPSTLLLRDGDAHYIDSDDSSTESVISDFDDLHLQSGFSDTFSFPSKFFGREYIMKLIEDLVILLRGLYRSYKDNFDIPTIIEYSIIFWKLRNNSSLISQIENLGIIEYLKFIIEDTNDDLTVQSKSPLFSSAKNLIKNIRLGKDSKVYATIYRVGMFVLASSIFESSELVLDKFGYNKFEIRNLQKKHRLSGNLLLDLADGVIFLLEKGYQIILTQSFDCIFHTEDEYSQLYDIVQDLKLKQYALSNPEALGFSESWYIKTLDDTIAKLKSVIKFASASNNPETKVFKHHLYDMELIKINRVLKMTTQSYRETPYSLLFFAPPGVGKTSLIKIVFRHFGLVHNLPTDDCYMYTRNPAANFADGFRTEQWCWVQDDIAFMKPDKLPNGDPTTAETIQLRNTVQFTPDQASIEDKGKVPFRGKLMLGSTNVEHLNAFHFFSCPSALQRRYPYVVDVAVKEKYCIPGTKMLDATKADCPLDEYPNYWIITIYKVKIPERLNQLATKHVELVTDDINEFLSWVSQNSLDHFVNEKKMTASFKNIQNVQICKFCYRNVKICQCSQLEIQSSSTFSFRNIKLIWYNIVTGVIYFSLIFSSAFTTLIFYLWLRQIVNDALLRMGNTFIYHALNRKFYQGCAKKIKYDIGYKKTFGILLGSITSCYALFKVVSYFKDESFTDQSLEEKQPVARTSERFNPWIASDFKLSSIDLTPPILSSNNQTDSEFEDMIARNVCSAFIRATENPRKRYTNILCLKGNIYLANAHWFDKLPLDTKHVDITILSDQRGDGVSTELNVIINFSDIRIFSKSDLAIFELPHLVPKRDITKYFPSRHVNLSFNGTLLTRRLTGELVKNQVNGVELKRRTDNISTHLFDHLVTFGTSVVLTLDGDCGSPLIAHTPKGHMIISIHRAGSSMRSAVGACVFKEHIDEILLNFEPLSVPDAYPLLADNHKDLLKLHSKSVFNYIDHGTAEVYGSLAGFKSAHKSRVCATIMQPFLLKHNYEVKSTRPDLGGWKPWRLAAQDLVEPTVAFDTSIVRACALAYCQSVLKRVGISEVKRTVEKYDQFTAINGAQGIAYVDKINRNTSAGYPFYKQKRHFLIDLPPQRGLDEPVGINSILQERVDFISERYSQGLRYKPIFVASLKDEAISFPKAAAGKIRVFGSAPVDWIIVVRKYLLSYVRFMQNNKVQCECAIGTVAQSGEWTELYKYITKHGTDRIVAGDFKKFDKKMSPVFIQQAFSIMSAICKLSGNYDDQDLEAIRAIGTDTAFPLMDFNGDLVQFYGSNPSGHSLTVIINSIVNSLYMRYVFVDLFYRNNPSNISIDIVFKTFDDKVSLLSYGDDNIMGVDKSIPWFNHTTIAESFSRMGIDYTMADKESESIPYISIQDASFLKRKWVFDVDLGYHMAPLEHDSIEKMLTVWVASDSISAHQQCISVISSAIREYFFYGREIFNQKRALFQCLLKYLKLEHLIVKSTLPTYDILAAQFLQNTSRVLNIDIKIDTETLKDYYYDQREDEIFTLQSKDEFVMLYPEVILILGFSSCCISYALYNLYLTTSFTLYDMITSVENMLEFYQILLGFALTLVIFQDLIQCVMYGHVPIFIMLFLVTILTMRMGLLITILLIPILYFKRFIFQRFCY